MGRDGVSVPESVSNSSHSQVRPSMQGIGMMGSLGSSSQMRPTGIPVHHPQRPVQSSVRPPSTATSGFIVPAVDSTVKKSLQARHFCHFTLNLILSQFYVGEEDKDLF
ncbi:hypothetical protein ACFX19_019300 [Malus domestica]